jgi:hypothetical protein
MTPSNNRAEAGVVTKLNPRSVADTVSRLTDLVAAKGIKHFGVIDQRAEARQVGLKLRETTLALDPGVSTGARAGNTKGGPGPAHSHARRNATKIFNHKS